MSFIWTSIDFTINESSKKDLMLIIEWRKISLLYWYSVKCATSPIGWSKPFKTFGIWLRKSVEWNAVCTNWIFIKPCEKVAPPWYNSVKKYCIIIQVYIHKYLKKFQNNAIIPPTCGGKSMFPDQEMSLNKFYDFSKYHIANILVKNQWTMKYIE